MTPSTLMMFICGAPRAGTTTLYRALRQHPEVCMSQRKETGVFLENYDKGLEWLTANYLSHYDGEPVVGEATTGHMQHPPSARRMGETVPGAKLVFILRDPVERLHSHYRFHRQSGRLGRDDDFSELIRDESSEWRRIQDDNGRYHKHLTRFATHFDRSQIKIFFLEDLKSDALATARKLYAFAGVDPSFAPDLSRSHNEGGMPRHEGLYRALQACWQPIRKRVGIELLDATQPVRDRVRDWMTEASSRSEMSAADRSYLKEVYREPNQRLAEWLDVDLSHWT
jgi:hypothetical protein